MRCPSRSHHRFTARRSAITALPLLLLGTGCLEQTAPAADRSTPRRVVSLSPTITEILFAVDAGDHVVGRTTFCNHPPAARDVETVGGMIGSSLSLERILTLRPDLVLAGSFGQQEVIERLRRRGIAVEEHHPGSVEDALRAIAVIGERLGHTRQASALVAELRAELAALDHRVDGTPIDARPRVFYLVWVDPLLTAGSQSFIGQLIERAGGRNLFPELEEGFPRVSLEQVVVRDPQVLLAPAHEGDTTALQALAERPGWSAVSALRRRGGLQVVDGDLVSRPGPRLGQALRALSRALQAAVEGEASTRGASLR